MNEKQIIDEINRVKKEKLECCECLDDLKRKWFENDKKHKECEERKKLLHEALTCLQGLKDDVCKRSNQLLRDENGITLIKQLRAVRTGEKDIDMQIEKTKSELNETRDKCKYFISKSNEVRKLIKHMQIANDKLSEEIDRILDEFDAIEAKTETSSLEHKEKRLKTDTESTITALDENANYATDVNSFSMHCESTCIKDPQICQSNCEMKQNTVEMGIKIEGCTDTLTTNVNTNQHEVTEEFDAIIKRHEREVKLEKCERGDCSSDKDNTQLPVVSSVNGDRVIGNKWDVTTRDITVVRIVNSHVYVGCINGVIRRINVNDNDDVIDYDKESTNKRVKALFIGEDESLLFACFDDGFVCCYDANTANCVSDYRLNSYIVVCVEAWKEIIAARGDKFITFLSMHSNITQLRKISVNGRFQSIIALQPLEDDSGVRKLLVLGKGWKPVVVNAVTGEYVMAIANQAIYSPAFVVLSNSIICTAFTQTPDSLKYKDSVLSFYNVSKTCERTKMEFMNGCVTAMKINGSRLLIALLRFNFTRLLCYDINEWKLLWITLIGYERVFALDFGETAIYFGCRNGCLHRISFDENSPFICEDDRCNCRQPFALQTDLRHTRFH